MVFQKNLLNLNTESLIWSARAEIGIIGNRPNNSQFCTGSLNSGES